MNQSQINTINKAGQRGRKQGNTANNKLKQTVFTESPFETLGRHVDPAHSDATSHEKPVLPKRTQNLNPYQGSPLGKCWRTGNLKFPRQLHGAPRDFSFPIAGG